MAAATYPRCANISAYYYLRIVLNMYVGEPVSPDPVRPTPLLALTAGAAVVGLLALGIFPFPVIEAAEAAARVLS